MHWKAARLQPLEESGIGSLPLGPVDFSKINEVKKQSGIGSSLDDLLISDSSSTPMTTTGHFGRTAALLHRI